MAQMNLFTSEPHYCRFNMDPVGKCCDNDIYRALDMAQLTELVQQQSAGLDTEVTEGGENFSVGQRQVGLTLLCKRIKPEQALFA